MQTSETPEQNKVVIEFPCEICGNPDTTEADYMLEPDLDHVLSDGMVVKFDAVPVHLCKEHSLKWDIVRTQHFHAFYAAEKRLFEEGVINVARAAKGVKDAGGSGTPQV